MFNSVSRRPLTDLRVRPQLETFENRDVPSATFQSYGGWAVVNPPVSPGVNLGTPVPGGSANISGSPAATRGLQVTQVITPVDTNNDLSSYEKVTFKFRDLDPSTHETVSLLVFRKMDGSPPPLILTPAALDLYKNAQTLLCYQSVTTQDGAELTLTVNLPKCDYQVDATAVPGGTLDLGSPIGFETALMMNLEGAIGTNACVDASPLTQGYWKNHSEAWGLNEMSLGGVLYTKTQLLDIFSTPVRGNGAISMAHQLIAAKLNMAAGAHPTQATMDAINAADVMLGNNSFFTTPLGTVHSAFSLSTASCSSLVSQLDAFNSSGI